MMCGIPFFDLRDKQRSKVFHVCLQQLRRAETEPNGKGWQVLCSKMLYKCYNIGYNKCIIKKEVIEWHRSVCA